jgi:hypothetical protein
MWGNFLDVPGGLDTLVGAYVEFFRRAREKVNSECVKELNFVSINIGGPPPIEFLRRIGEMREAEFPEAFVRVVIYPMQTASGVGELTRDVMTSSAWKRDKGKTMVKMAATTTDLISDANVGDDFFPDDVLYASRPTAGEMQGAKDARRDFVMSVSPEPSVAPSCETVVVRNTFLEPVEGKQILRRRRSFSEFGNGGCHVADVTNPVYFGERPKINSLDNAMYIFSKGDGSPNHLRRGTWCSPDCPPEDPKQVPASIDIDSTDASAGGSGDSDVGGDSIASDHFEEPASSPVVQPAVSKKSRRGKRRKSGWTRQRRSRAAQERTVANETTVWTDDEFDSVQGHLCATPPHLSTTALIYQDQVQTIMAVQPVACFVQVYAFSDGTAPAMLA